MADTTRQHPVIEYTMDLVRQVQLLNARETLLKLSKEILVVKDVEKLTQAFPTEAAHFFDNFAASPTHPAVNILRCEFSDCDRELPWNKVPNAKAVYAYSTNNEEEVEARRDDTGEEDEDDGDYAEEEATYVEGGCWLINPNLALIASVRMGPYEDETHNADGELEIVHSWDRQALLAYLETRAAAHPEQIENAKTAFDQVFGLAADDLKPPSFAAAARP